MRLNPLHKISFVTDFIRNTGRYFDNNRATGRTEVLALMHLAEAINKPHTWVYFCDHHKTTPANRSLGERCRRMAHRLEYQHFTFREDKMCFGEPPCRA